MGTRDDLRRGQARGIDVLEIRDAREVARRLIGGAQVKRGRRPDNQGVGAAAARFEAFWSMKAVSAARAGAF